MGHVTVVAYGAGLDSTAMLVGLRARGERPARLRELQPATFIRLEELERSAKRTKRGAVMTFSGDERPLDVWTTGRKPYKPVSKPCPVCGRTRTKQPLGCKAGP